MSRLAFAGLLAVSMFAATPAAFAQETADTSGLIESCLGAQQFLLGDVPEGVDPASILTPLCGCLATSFGTMPQADVDILAADLRGEGTQELHDAHGSYSAVEEKARDGLNACFASPEVMAVMPAVPAEPAVPATPATPATPADPATPATPAEPATPADPATPAEPATPAP